MLLRRHPDFARLWLGQVVSVSGDGMQRVALLWWASQRGGTALLVAVATCAIVPLVALSPLGGWAADRYDRRRLMVAADGLRLVTSALLAAAVLAGDPPMVVVCGLIALTAVGTAVFDPTYAATVPTVVPEADRDRANGLNLANSAAGGLVGPILGGTLIALIGVGGVLVVNAATFAWSAAFVAMCHLPAPAGRIERIEGERPDRRDAGPGPVRTVLADLQLRRLVALAAALNLVVAPVPLLIISLAVGKLGVGARTYGALVALLSAGLLGGALGAAHLAGRRQAMAVAMASLGVCLIGLGFLPLPGVVVALVVGGVAIAVANTALMTVFQRTVPAEVQGRVFGTVGALAEGLRPLGLLVAGPLLAVAGVTGAFAVVGIGVLAATATWALPHARRSRLGVTTTKAPGQPGEPTAHLAGAKAQ